MATGTEPELRECDAKKKRPGPSGALLEKLSQTPA